MGVQVLVLFYVRHLCSLARSSSPPGGSSPLCAPSPRWQDLVYAGWKSASHAFAVPRTVTVTVTVTVTMILIGLHYYGVGKSRHGTSRGARSRLWRGVVAIFHQGHEGAEPAPRVEVVAGALVARPARRHLRSIPQARIVLADMVMGSPHLGSRGSQDLVATMF